MSMSDMTAASGNSTMTTMMAVFQVTSSTPLYSMAWTPSTQGQYAGTCVFLIALAAVFRLLLAGKAVLEARWTDRELDRRYVVVQGRPSLAARLSSGGGDDDDDDDDDDDAGKSSTKGFAVLSENGVEEQVMVVRRRPVAHTHVRPWRLSVDPVRAALDTVLAGVGYLLMLAVMSMNVGYFMSVLGGVFLGSLLVGRYIHLVDH